MSGRRHWAWIIGPAGVLLALALALQIWPHAATRDLGVSAQEVRVATVLPPMLGEVLGRDEPIASTEELRKAVANLLNFDDGGYRIYALPQGRISIYVAWWRVGRMSPRLVAAHTPDVCWPANGWVRDRSAEVKQGALREELRAKGFAEGEHRVFTMNGKPEYVVFWHKVGHEILSYKTGYAPPWWAWLDELWRGGLNLKQEQIFVRISSDKPLDTLFADREMEPLRQMLHALGLGDLNGASGP
jgi:hypothetical protein